MTATATKCELVEETIFVIKQLLTVVKKYTRVKLAETCEHKENIKTIKYLKYTPLVPNNTTQLNSWYRTHERMGYTTKCIKRKPRRKRVF